MKPTAPENFNRLDPTWKAQVDLSLQSTSAHHKWRGQAVGKVIPYCRLQLNS